MSETGYVAALEREVALLIRDWRRTHAEYSGRNFEFFEQGDKVLVCSGIGPDAARRAAEALIALYQPKQLVSVGFAGALEENMKVGEIIEPAIVVDARDGSRASTDRGAGVLISFTSVANAEQKRKLAQAYGAQAVDMEASSVARGAQAHGLSFRAVKVVSDEAAFSMPPMDRFIDGAGNFSGSRFALFAALRPMMWASVVRLARNSQLASRALCRHVQREIDASIEPSEGTLAAKKQ